MWLNICITLYTFLYPTVALQFHIIHSNKLVILEEAKRGASTVVEDGEEEKNLID